MKAYRGYVSKIPNANPVDRHADRRSGPQFDVHIKSDSKSNKTEVSAEFPVRDNSVPIVLRNRLGWVVKPPQQIRFVRNL